MPKEPRHYYSSSHRRTTDKNVEKMLEDGYYIGNDSYGFTIPEEIANALVRGNCEGVFLIWPHLLKEKV